MDLAKAIREAATGSVPSNKLEAAHGGLIVLDYGAYEMLGGPSFSGQPPAKMTAPQPEPPLTLEEIANHLEVRAKAVQNRGSSQPLAGPAIPWGSILAILIPLIQKWLTR